MKQRRPLGGAFWIFEGAGQRRVIGAWTEPGDRRSHGDGGRFDESIAVPPQCSASKRVTNRIPGFNESTQWAANIRISSPTNRLASDPSRHRPE